MLSPPRLPSGADRGWVLIWRLGCGGIYFCAPLGPRPNLVPVIAALRAPASCWLSWRPPAVRRHVGLPSTATELITPARTAGQQGGALCDLTWSRERCHSLCPSKSQLHPHSRQEATLEWPPQATVPEGSLTGGIEQWFPSAVHFLKNCPAPFLFPK